MKTDTIQTRNRITTCLIALLTFCLVLTGIFFIAPIEAEAAVGETFYENGIQYKILTEQEGNYTVEISNINIDTWFYSDSRIIPSTVERKGTEYTVVGIGESAFLNKSCYGITITLPDSIKYIANNAFKGFTKGYVVMQEGVETIGDGAFENSSAMSGEIVLPDSVTHIGDYAFYGNASLWSITTNATEIGSYAFAGVPHPCIR